MSNEGELLDSNDYEEFINNEVALRVSRPSKPRDQLDHVAQGSKVALPCRKKGKGTTTN